MFASVLHLDRKAISSLGIGDPYSLHRAVYSLYEDVRTEQEKKSSVSSGFLYADQGGDDKGRKILMLSNRKPAESINGYGQVLTKEIPPRFLESPRYRFSTIVNPTRRSALTARLVPIKDREEIERWFADRAIRDWGFEASQESSFVERVNVLQFQKNNRQITVMQAHVQGVLTVTDREKFVKSFTEGIGRGRAYGCGLLQLTPIAEDLFSN